MSHSYRNEVPKTSHISSTPTIDFIDQDKQDLDQSNTVPFNESPLFSGNRIDNQQQPQLITSPTSQSPPSAPISISSKEPYANVSQSTTTPDKNTEMNMNGSGSSQSSLALDNLIEQYDEKSIMSKSASILTFFYSFGQSKKERYDDTLDNISGSYYSAMPDMFALNEMGPRKMPVTDDRAKDHSKEEHLYLWQTCDTKNNKSENNQMATNSDFQVFWNDITYQIKPELDFNNIRQRVKNTCNLSNLQRLLHSKNTEKTLAEPSSSIYPVQDTITILNHADGSFKSGELTALMGPSGAGKTSLLNFLSRRKEKDYSGWLTLTGRSKKVKISMIPQHDSLPGNLTVRENLVYASRLKNAHIVIDHNKNIETIARLLGIDGCLETKTKKISGGEQKRLSIAQELVSKPDVLILDEPTSGLDSLTCYKTLSILRQLVRASLNKLIDPIAIVLSIHQPQQEVFELFDKIYMISVGGIPIYDGPPTDCVQYVEQHVGISMPSADYNPASFMIEIASGEYGREPISKLQSQLKINYKDQVSRLAQDDESNNQFEDYAMNWRSQVLKDAKLSKFLHQTPTYNHDHSSIKKIDSESIQQRTLNLDPRIPKASSTNSDRSLHKTGILLERCWVSELRDPKQSIVKFLYFLVTPVVLSFMLGKEAGVADGCPRYITSFELKDVVRNNSELLDKNVQEDTLLSLENLGLYFMTIFSITIAIAGAMAVTFSTDIRRSLKEFHNGWYPMSCYLVARIVSEIPVHIVLPTMTMALMFLLTGQSAAYGMSNMNRFLLLDAGVILSSFVAQILGMIIGAIFIGDITTALFVSQGILLPFVFVSGFVARTKNMHTLVYLLSFTSFLKHTLDIAVIARYGFGTCLCNASIVTGKETQVLNVPERLKTMTDMWMSSSLISDNSDNQEDDALITNGTATDYLSTSTEKPPEQDIFQLFGRQVFLYNTRGLDIKSCDDMVPYQLMEVSLADKDMYFAFSALLVYITIVTCVLFITVRLVMHFKKSL